MILCLMYYRWTAPGMGKLLGGVTLGVAGGSAGVAVEGGALYMRAVYTSELVAAFRERL